MISMQKFRGGALQQKFGRAFGQQQAQPMLPTAMPKPLVGNVYAGGTPGFNESAQAGPLIPLAPQPQQASPQADPFPESPFGGAWMTSADPAAAQRFGLLGSNWWRGMGQQQANPTTSPQTLRQPFGYRQGAQPAVGQRMSNPQAMPSPMGGWRGQQQPGRNALALMQGARGKNLLGQ